MRRLTNASGVQRLTKDDLNSDEVELVKAELRGYYPDEFISGFIDDSGLTDFEVEGFLMGITRSEEFERHLAELENDYILIDGRLYDMGEVGQLIEDYPVDKSELYED
jgi:hypothetical protein